MCGSNVYNKVNRIVLNTLNKMKFKCQNQPKCDEVITYDKYIAHMQECEAG